jgi:hypothetical protein
MSTMTHGADIQCRSGRSKTNHAWKNAPPANEPMILKAAKAWKLVQIPIGIGSICDPDHIINSYFTIN